MAPSTPLGTAASRSPLTTVKTLLIVSGVNTSVPAPAGLTMVASRLILPNALLRISAPPSLRDSTLKVLYACAGLYPG